MKRPQRVQAIKRYLGLYYDKFINYNEKQLRKFIYKSKLCRIFYSLNLIEDICSNIIQWAYKYKLPNTKIQWAKYYWNTLEKRDLGDKVIDLFDETPISQNGHVNFIELANTIYDLIVNCKSQNTIPI